MSIISNEDLYGGGYSDTPDLDETPYTAELYTVQLALLMQKVGWQKANIVGLSMVRLYLPLIDLSHWPI